MRFTRNNLTKDDKKLLGFLYRDCVPMAHKLENGHLVAVYDTDIAILILQEKIKRFKRDTRFKQWIPLWENNIKKLEALKTR